MNHRIARRLTKQRYLILEELQRTKTHPTGEELLKSVRGRLPSVSMGTLYRNLNFLRDEGEILELRCGRYSCHYDADTRLHYHFFCLNCQRVLDLDLPAMSGVDQAVAQKTGLGVRFHRLDFYGYCHVCKTEKEGVERPSRMRPPAAETAMKPGHKKERSR